MLQMKKASKDMENFEQNNSHYKMQNNDTNLNSSNPGVDKERYLGTENKINSQIVPPYMAPHQSQSRAPYSKDR